MGSKKRGVLIALVLLLVPGVFKSQDRGTLVETEDYEIISEGEELTFIQKLHWEAEDDILYYDVTLERRKIRDKYISYATIQTEKNEWELKLPVGDYRFKVAVYNFLGLLEYETDWSFFTVLHAYQPELNEPKFRTIYLSQLNNEVLTFKGKKLFKESLYVFRKEADVGTDYQEGSGYIGTVKRVKGNHKKAQIHFDLYDMDVGLYRLFVRNPGGLTAETEVAAIKIENRPRCDVTLSIGYTLPVQIFDCKLKNNLDMPGFDASCIGRFAVYPWKRDTGHYGFGINATVSDINKKFKTYDIEGKLFTGHLNFEYHRPLRKENTFFNGYAGFGIVRIAGFEYKFDNGFKSEILNSSNLSIDFGVAVQGYFNKDVYFEEHMGMVIAFAKDMVIGLVVPSIALGWRF